MNRNEINDKVSVLNHDKYKKNLKKKEIIYETTIFSLKLDNFNYINKYNDDEIELFKNWNNYILYSVLYSIYRNSNGSWILGSTLVNYLLDLPVGGDRDIDIAIMNNEPNTNKIHIEYYDTYHEINTRYINVLESNDIVDIIKSELNIDKYNTFHRKSPNFLKTFYLCKKYIDRENKYNFLNNCSNKDTKVHLDIVNLSNKNNNVRYWNRIIPIFGSKAIYSDMEDINCNIEILPIFYDYIVNDNVKTIEFNLNNFLLLIKGLRVFNTEGILRENGEYLPIRSKEKFKEKNKYQELKEDIKYENIKIPINKFKFLFRIGDPVIINCKSILSFWIYGELLTKKIPKDYEYIYGKKKIINEKIKDILNGKSDDRCNICQETYKITSPIIITKCDHKYHLKCYINMIIKYVEGKISIFDKDSRKDLLLNNMNSCAICRTDLTKIDWYSNNKTLRVKKGMLKKEKCQKTKAEYTYYGKDELILVNGKSREFCHLLIEDIRTLGYESLEDYLVHKWNLIERLYAFEKINNEMKTDYIEEIYEKILTDYIR